MIIENETVSTETDGNTTPENDNIHVEVSERDEAPSAKTEEPPASEAETATEENADEAARAEVEEGRKPVQKLPDWAQKKLAEAAYNEREAKRRAKQLEDELEAARKGMTTTTTKADEDAARAAAPEPGAQFGGYKSQQEFEAAVQAETNKRIAAERATKEEVAFTAACNEVYAKGKEAFKDDFDAAVQNLQNVGVMNREILDVVLATDDPAKVLLELGSDPDRASALLSMNPAKRSVEIAKLAVAAPKKEPEQISRAPAPIKPIEGSAKPNSEPQDDDDDATWYAKREAQLRQRGAA